MISNLKCIIQSVWEQTRILFTTHKATYLAIVQDRYDVENPLKAATHAKRGTGTRKVINLNSEVIKGGKAEMFFRI